MFVAVVAVISILFILSGHTVLRWFGWKRSDGLTIIYAWGLMAGITGYVFMLVGLFGCLTPAASIIWLLILIALSWFARGKIRDIWNIIRAISLRDILSGGIGGVIIIGLITVLLAVSFVGALAFPANIDALNYHFALLKQYIQSGSLSFNPTFLHAAIPFSAEMLSGFVAMLSDFRGGQLVQFIAAIMLIVGLFCAGRRLKDSLSAVLAVAAFLSTLFLAFIIAEAKNDQLLALFSFLSLYAFAKSGENSDNRLLLIGAVFSGLACGVKEYGLGVPVAGFAIILIERAAHRNRFSARSLLLAILTSVVVAIPWYLRSYFLTGNPVHPFFYTVFSDRYWDSVLEFAYNVRRANYVSGGLWQFIISPLQMTFDADLYRARLGPIYLTALPLALFFRPKNRLLNFIGWSSFAYYVLWFWFLRDARFLIPILPGLALYGAGIMRGLIDKGKIIRLVVFVAVIANLGLSLTINFRNQYRKFPAVVGAQTEDEFYRQLKDVDLRSPGSGEYKTFIPEYDFLLQVNKAVGDSGSIGVFAYNEPIIYYFLHPRVYLLTPFHQSAFDFKAVFNPDDVRRKLDSLGIRYIVSDTGDDTVVPPEELLWQYPEFKSTLTGVNHFLAFLHTKCTAVVSEGRYRCFHVEG